MWLRFKFRGLVSLGVNVIWFVLLCDLGYIIYFFWDLGFFVKMDMILIFFFVVVLRIREEKL